MNEQPSKEELFTKAPDLETDDFVCYVALDRSEIEIGRTWMNVEQARALRDWLNQVLP